jgi:hypothetical protein
MLPVPRVSSTGGVCVGSLDTASSKTSSIHRSSIVHPYHWLRASVLRATIGMSVVALLLACARPTDPEPPTAPAPPPEQVPRAERDAVPTPPDPAPSDPAPSDPASSDPADQFIRAMDQAPPDQRPPDWEQTRRLMLRPAPKVGDAAPDFTLATVDGKTQVVRSQFAAGKPMVLVFGSFT